MSEIEQTLVIVKPDAVVRSLVGKIIQRFEDAGLKIISAKMVRVDADLARKHYSNLEQRQGQAVYDVTVKAMQAAPVLAITLEGVDAISNVRRLVGSTYPNEASPGTIRGDFAHQSQAYCAGSRKVVSNLIHASGDPTEAEYEINLWFREDERFEYGTLAEQYTF